MYNRLINIVVVNYPQLFAPCLIIKFNILFNGLHHGVNVMAYKSLTQEQMQEAIDAFNSEGSKTEAAKILGLNINTYRSRYNNAIRLGLKPNEIVEDSIIDKLSEAHNKIRQL